MFGTAVLKMDVKEENICRLCLKIAETGFEIINEITKELFEVLLLRMNLDLSMDPIICKDCAKVVKKSFDFKSVCIDTEEIVFSFAINKNRATFELKDVYKDEKGIEIVDDNSICRFCFNYLPGSNFVSLDTLINDVTFAEMLQKLVPEMDLDVINNPVACTSCRQNLECYIKFIENCLDVEEKITKYIQNQGTPFFFQIKLSEILHFSSRHISESDYTQMRGIKQEEDIGEPYSEVYDGEFIKSEELDIKEEEINFSEIACEIPSEMPVNKLNMPDGLKTGKVRKESVQDSSSIPTTSYYGMCMCGTIQNCIKCDMESNMASTETGLGKAYQRKCKGKVNKKKHLIVNTKNISKAQIFGCAMCAYQAKQKGHLKRHMLIHKDITEVEMYKCSMCTYQTKVKGSLRKHMLIHKDITEVEMYKCSMCTYQAKLKGHLKAHMLIHKDITEVEMYKCSLCTYQAKQKGHLKRHMLIHKDSTEMEMYKCSLCTYQAKQKGHLKRHMLIHKDSTEVEIYRCSMCIYQTKVKCYLKKHMLTHKDLSEVEIYRCSMCTYQTKHKAYLKTHMLIHKDITEVEMYKCAMCTYETKRKNDLKTHMLIHKDITEVETYKCAMCTYETKRKKDLKTHMSIHKDISEVEMYKCSMCTFQTRHKGNLRTHMLTHKDIAEVEMYKCSICTYQAKQNSHLKCHMLIHKDITEVEMYRCSMCTYETKRKDTLKSHMLVHKDISKVEMYKCSMCTYQAKQKSYLRKHMLIHKNKTKRQQQ